MFDTIWELHDTNEYPLSFVVFQDTIFVVVILDCLFKTLKSGTQWYVIIPGTLNVLWYNFVQNDVLPAFSFPFPFGIFSRWERLLQRGSRWQQRWRWPRPGASGSWERPECLKAPRPPRGPRAEHGPGRYRQRRRSIPAKRFEFDIFLVLLTDDHKMMILWQHYMKLRDKIKTKRKGNVVT